MNRVGGSAGIKSLAIFIAFVFLFLVAVILDNPYLYLMAITIGLLPLASYALAWFFAAKYSSRRTHAATGPEGRRFPVTLEVVASGGLPQAALQVGDQLPKRLHRTDGFLGALEDWDGHIGSRRYIVEPEVRGVYKIGPTRLEMTDPLGLFRFEADLGDATELVVHPTPLLAGNALAGGGGSWGLRERDGNLRRGEGMEFHGVREYQQGDPLRRVHWRTSARTGRLAVVEYESAYQQNLIVALDLAKGTTFGEGRETTLEYAVKIAATLCHRTMLAGGGLTLISQNFRVDIPPQLADKEAGRFQVMDTLAHAVADSDVSLGETLAAAGFEWGSSYAVLTSGDDDLLRAHLIERTRFEDDITVYFLEPVSFGGPMKQTPAIPKARLRVVERDHSPWLDGGKRLEKLLHDHA